MRKKSPVFPVNYAIIPNNGSKMKRGQLVTFCDVTGKEFTGIYSKMQKGNFCFTRFATAEKYQLNKAGYLIPC